MRSLDLAGLVVVAGRTLGLEPAIDSVFAENRELRAEVRRLRELLRRHGIEPDGGESRTA